MRRLVVPAALSVVSLTFGCGSSSPADGGLADAADAPDVTDVGVDVADVTDVADAGDGGDAAIVCEGRRAADGGIECREENVRPGGGFFCVRFRCDAEDGGTNYTDCCRLVA